MMKKLRYLVLFIFLSLILIPNINAKEAETLGDLRREYESLLAEKQANDNKTAQAKKEIAEKEAAINQAEKDLTKAKAEEEEAAKNIEESNEKIKELSSESEKILTYMQQMQGSNAYVEYVSGASSMTELVTRLEAVKQVTGYIQTTMDNIDAEIDRNEILKKELEQKQINLKNQKASYETTIERLTGNIASYDKFALGINEKVDIAKANYEDYKKQCKQNLNREDDNAILSECSKVPVNGGWLKPLGYGVITSPVGGRWGEYHNALDIGGNNEGTNVYAAAAGRVAGFVPRYRCGGNMLYIQVVVGGQKYTTMYYHLKNVYVKVGDIVDQNTVIGTVGGYSTSTLHGGYDQCTTGAHLHYGVAKGWYSGHTNNVIIPPGFPNWVGYRFYSRMDYYGNR